MDMTSENDRFVVAQSKVLRALRALHNFSLDERSGETCPTVPTGISRMVFVCVVKFRDEGKDRAAAAASTYENSYGRGLPTRMSHAPHGEPVRTDEFISPSTTSAKALLHKGVILGLSARFPCDIFHADDFADTVFLGQNLSPRFETLMSMSGHADGALVVRDLLFISGTT